MFKWIYIHILKRKQYKESKEIMRILIGDPKDDFCTNSVCFNNNNGNCNCLMMAWNPRNCNYRNTNKPFRLMN